MTTSGAEAGSVRLVVENARRPEDRDGVGWFYFDCGALVHRVGVAIADVVRDLPPLFRRVLRRPRGEALPCRASACPKTERGAPTRPEQSPA